MLKNIILAGLGGGIGAVLRYGITLLFSALHWSSTFSTQSMHLLQSGRYLPAFAYILGTVTVCILFAFIGYYIGTRLGGR